MAKGNLFLGMASGSVGDVTFYRRNGQQVSRARNRKVYNPSTQGQLVQRAVTSTVVQAYRAGRVLFDHSFQGKRVGAENQAMFMKRNMDILRSVLVQELNAATVAASGKAVVVGRGATTPAAFTFRVSEGTLYQNLFSIAASSGDANQLEVSLPAAGSATTLAEYCAANGIEADDIYTIVAFGIRPNSGWSVSDVERFARDYDTGFGFIRLRVKESALSAATPIGTATFGDLFEMNFADATPLPESTLLTAAINIDQVVASALTGTMGVIRSRENSGERSVCDLQAPATINWGIKAEYMLDAWTPGSEKAGSSTLILEGGGF